MHICTQKDRPKNNTAFNKNYSTYFVAQIEKRNKTHAAIKYFWWNERGHEQKLKKNATNNSTAHAYALRHWRTRSTKARAPSPIELVTNPNEKQQHQLQPTKKSRSFIFPFHNFQSEEVQARTRTLNTPANGRVSE